MLLDVITVIEDGVSARFPKARHALRIFMVLRASTKTAGAPSAAYAFDHPPPSHTRSHRVAAA